MFVKRAVKLPKNEAVFRLEALVFKTLLDLHDSVFTSHESPIIFLLIHSKYIQVLTVSETNYLCLG